MRTLSILAMLVCAAPAFGQENDAEKLYRAMEEKMRSAKELHLIFEAEMAGDGKKMTCKGNLWLVQGNKCRIEMDTFEDAKQVKRLIISDGMSTYTKVDDKARTEKQQPAGAEVDQASGFIARLGMAGSFFFALKVTTGGPLVPPDKKAAFDLDKEAPVKDFKLGAKEEVGLREAQVVDYQVGLPGHGFAKVAVWIDPETQLPIKRTLVATKKDGAEQFRVTERYSMIGLGFGVIDAKLFELPK